MGRRDYVPIEADYLAVNHFIWRTREEAFHWACVNLPGVDGNPGQYGADMLLLDDRLAQLGNRKREKDTPMHKVAVAVSEVGWPTLRTSGGIPVPPPVEITGVGYRDPSRSFFASGFAEQCLPLIAAIPKKRMARGEYFLYDLPGLMGPLHDAVDVVRNVKRTGHPFIDARMDAMHDALRLAGRWNHLLIGKHLAKDQLRFGFIGNEARCEALGEQVTNEVVAAAKTGVDQVLDQAVGKVWEGLTQLKPLRVHAAQGIA